MKTAACLGVPRAEVRFRSQTPMSELQLGRELGRGITGTVRAGVLRGQRVAVKLSDINSGHVDVPLLQHEAAVYGALGKLQGDVIPRLIGCGWTLGGAVFYVATELVEGVPLSSVTEDARQMAQMRAEAKESLMQIRGLGVAHNDIRRENLLIRPPEASGKRVIFIDFGFSETGASPSAKTADMRALHAAFQSLQQGECRPKQALAGCFSQFVSCGLHQQQRCWPSFSNLPTGDLPV